MIKLGNKFDIGFPLQEKLFPTIHLFWKSYQDKMMVKLKGLCQVQVISGDGRHDSMGIVQNLVHTPYCVALCPLSSTCSGNGMVLI